MKIILILSIWALTTVLALGDNGIASWYGNELRGQLMANGAPFNPDAMTCASNKYRLGTKLKVSYNTNSIIVIITDRGPGLNRMIDLSYSAFKQLANPKIGLIEVTVEPYE